MKTQFKEKHVALYKHPKFFRVTLVVVLAALILASTFILLYQGGTYSAPTGYGSISGVVWVNSVVESPADPDVQYDVEPPTDAETPDDGEWLYDADVSDEMELPADQALQYDMELTTDSDVQYDVEPSTDPDMPMDIEKQPIPGYPVYLYDAGDLTQPIDTTVTDADGFYEFENLASGEYVVGITLEAVAGREGMFLTATANDSVLGAFEDFDGPPTAFSGVIEIIGNMDNVDSINNINVIENGKGSLGAGNTDATMQTTIGFAPMSAITLGNLKNANIHDTVSIDSYTWVVVRKQTIGSGQNAIPCVYLIMRGYIYDNQPFGTTTDYPTSALRDRMTEIYTTYLPTIRAIAVRPVYTDHTNVATPTTTQGVAAGNQTQDILFAPSYGDMHQWITNYGSTMIPSNHPLHNSGGFPRRFYCRTRENSAMVTGVNVSANSLDRGIQIVAMYASDVPAVWVNANAVNREVNVYYVDTKGNPILAGGTSSKTYNVTVGNTFTLTSSPSDVPTIPGYQYKEWKKGASGTPQGGNPNLTSAEVIKGTDIYLVYESTKPERYLVSKDSNPSVILSTWHWLADAVTACGTDGPYTITATENDTDVTDSTAVSVLFPSTKTITLTSNTSTPWTITQPNAARHIRVEGSLTMENIVLDGNGTAGGIDTIKTLTMNAGAVIQNCKNSMFGGGVNVTGGTFTMNDGSLIKDNIAQSGTTSGGGGGVHLNNSTFNMNGGTISGNIGHIGQVASGQYATGGGVYVGNGGTFNMYDTAEISGNKGGTASGASGGGVYVIGTGKFNMYGGTISDNIASTVSYGPGGGVSVLNGGTFNMSGGIITRNIVAVNVADSTGNGGGVNVAIGSTFNMSGTAEISYNTGSVNGTGNGGGVYVDKSTFTIKDTAVIKNNTASQNGNGYGGGVYLSNLSQFTASGTAQISGNTARNGDGGGIFSEDYDYSDPVSMTKYSPIKSIASTIVFSGNTSVAAYRPPNNGPSQFDKNLLNNDNINYHHPLGLTTTLTISETVVGDYANKNKDFNYSIYFEDSGGTALPSGTTFSYIKEAGGNTIESGTLEIIAGGMAPCNLKHGQKIIISEVGMEGKIRIVEAKDPYYDASFVDSVLGYKKSNDTGPQMLDVTPDRVFDFTNERIEVPETAIDAGQLGILISLPVLVLLTALVFWAARANYRRRRKEIR